MSGQTSRTVEASLNEFAGCVSGETQFVSMPVVTHTLVQQPVTFSQVKREVTYNQVPISQVYKKTTLSHQTMNQCDQQPAPVMVAATQKDPAVGSPCGSSPYHGGSGTQYSGYGQGMSTFTPSNYYYGSPAQYSAQVYSQGPMGYGQAQGPAVESYAALF